MRSKKKKKITFSWESAYAAVPSLRTARRGCRARGRESRNRVSDLACFAFSGVRTRILTAPLSSFETKKMPLGKVHTVLWLFLNRLSAYEYLFKFYGRRMVGLAAFFWVFFIGQLNLYDLNDLLKPPMRFLKTF